MKQRWIFDKKNLPWMILVCCLGLPFNLFAALPVDDFEATKPVNLLGGNWITFSDGSSKIEFTHSGAAGVNSQSQAAKIYWEFKPGTSVLRYTGLQTYLRADMTSVDLRKYQGVRFHIRGRGELQFFLDTDDTRNVYNHYYYPFELTTDWKYYEIPFQYFTQSWGTRKLFDRAHVFAIGLNMDGLSGRTGEAELDQIELYTSGEATQNLSVNPVLELPKVDQTGYLQDAEKICWICEPFASPLEPFQILDEAGKAVYSGKFTGQAFDDRASSGEMVLKGDFSTVAKPGKYIVVTAGGRKSHSFNIQNSVYLPVFHDALRSFYLIRCGVAIDDSISGLKHPPCHVNDAKIRGKSGQIDAAGGWHNAGDFGKWTHMEAISVAYFLWLYELRKDFIATVKTDIPESGNSLPDILDEADWGLTWLFKMQQKDGSVFHKVDIEPDFCFGTTPDQDPFTRFASFQGAKDKQEPSTMAIASFIAVMSQASRVFSEVDQSYAEQCRFAALKSWQWLSSHPLKGQTDPYYLNPDPLPYLLWAQAEIFRLTGDQSLLKQIRQDFTKTPYQDFSWLTPQALAYITLCLDPRTDAGLKNKITKTINSYSAKICDLADATGYGVALKPTEYHWESNESLMYRANCLIFASIITGNPRYQKVALRQLHYILGANSLDRSFVTGHGANPTTHPYHWIYSSYHLLIPGWVAGGSNSFTNGVDSSLAALINMGYPPAKCYLDMANSYGSWGSNEGETSENAALVFLAGYFSK